MKSNYIRVWTVAAALAATSSSALAVIDINAANAPVKYAEELKVLNADGRVVTTNGGNALDVSGTAGFASPNGTTRYVRFDLTGALFDAAPTLAQTDSGGAGGSVETLLSGGDDNTFAIFSVAPSSDGGSADTVRVTDAWTLACATYQLDPTVTTTITYKLFETAGDATNAAQPLATQDSSFTQHIAGSAPASAIVGTDLTATVASGFGEFAAPANISAASSGTLGALGQLDVSAVVAATATRKPGGAVSGSGDYLTAAQNITITGDVSVGTFTSQTGADCTGGTIACTKAADNASCVIAATAATADMYFCVTLAADSVIGKGGYTAALATDTAVTGALGSVKYDTTTVELPYVTTYEGYNQRIFIDNRGATAAYYSTTFTTEAGVTAADGASATGTLAANKIATVKVADLVTFTGGTRGSATLEIEAQSGSIWVTSQIVDLGTGVTDTLALHPADNSVGSCTNTITQGTPVIAAGTPVITAAAVAGAGAAATATATAHNASTGHNASYAYSTCTD